MSRQMKSK